MVLPGKRNAVGGRVGWLPIVVSIVAGFTCSATSVANEPTVTESSDTDQLHQDVRRHFEQGETVLEDADYLWRAESWSDFETKTREVALQSLRLIDVEIDIEGDETHYIGVWRTGTGSFALWTCPTWEAFSEKWQEMAMNGLQLIDIEVYRDQGEALYFGLFREDMSEARLWKDQDWNEISQ